VLHEALGTSAGVHTPRVILGADGKKLSKRAKGAEIGVGCARRGIPAEAVGLPRGVGIPRNEVHPTQRARPDSLAIEAMDRYRTTELAGFPSRRRSSGYVRYARRAPT